MEGWRAPLRMNAAPWAATRAWKPQICSPDSRCTAKNSDSQ